MREELCNRFILSGDIQDVALSTEEGRRIRTLRPYPWLEPRGIVH